MNTLVLSGLLLLVLLVLVMFWRRGKAKKPLPYELQETFFSPTERSFLEVLERAVGEQVRIFAKVRVADVLTPEAGLGKSKWQQYFNKVSARHFDYLLCRPSDLSLVCAIERDDSSHRHQQRKKRDLFLKMACDSAGLPLLQIPASSHYLVEELREQIMPLLAKPVATQADELMPGERREPTFNPLLLEETNVDSAGFSAAPTATTYAADSSDPPALTVVPPAPKGELVDTLFEEEKGESLCPRCDAPLVEREAKKGPHAGRLFLACSRFPQCRYAAPRHSH